MRLAEESLSAMMICRMVAAAAPTDETEAVEYLPRQLRLRVDAAEERDRLVGPGLDVHCVVAGQRMDVEREGDGKLEVRAPLRLCMKRDPVARFFSRDAG